MVDFLRQNKNRTKRSVITTRWQALPLRDECLDRMLIVDKIDGRQFDPQMHVVSDLFLEILKIFYTSMPR